jgi:hypothetical protein
MRHPSSRALALVALLSWASPALAQDNAAPPPPRAAAAQDPVKPPQVKGEVTLKQSFEVVKAPQAAQAPPVDPVAAAQGDDPQGPTVGSHLKLTLEVTRPGDTTIALPEDQETGRFELLAVQRQPPGPDQQRQAQITETIEMIFAVYRPGRHVLEPFTLSVLDADGGVTRVQTQPVEVKVDSVTANMKDPQMPALRDPVPVWIEDWTLVWVLSTLAGLLLAGGVGALLYRTLRPEPPPPPGPPPPPAHEVALEKLQSLRREDLISQEEYEAFYVRLSGILREYLGRRYNLSLADKAGLELTTGELVSSLREVKWPRGFDGHKVETFLYDCDIVKFARYAPTSEEADKLLQEAFDIVQQTRATALGQQALGSQAREADDA